MVQMKKRKGVLLSHTFEKGETLSALPPRCSGSESFYGEGKGGEAKPLIHLSLKRGKNELRTKWCRSPQIISSSPAKRKGKMTAMDFAPSSKGGKTKRHPVAMNKLKATPRRGEVTVKEEKVCPIYMKCRRCEKGKGGGRGSYKSSL